MSKTILYLQNIQLCDCLVLMNVDPSINVTLRNTQLLKAWIAIRHLCAIFKTILQQSMKFGFIAHRN